MPKFSRNKLKYYPHQIISKLRIQNNRSFNEFYAHEKDVGHTLQFPNEDMGRHKLILRFIENLECTSKYREPAHAMMQKLRSHTSKCCDVSTGVLEHKGESLKLEIIRETFQENYLDNSFSLDMKL